MVIGSLLFGVALGGCKRSQPPPPPEVPRSSLTMKDGRLVRGNPASESGLAFTGFVLERYADGALQSRSSVSNGLLHGLSEGFYTNGAVQVRESFVAGASHGLRVKWFPSGAKQAEAMIQNGQLHGTFRRWDESGALVEQIEMRDGQPDGVSLAFHADGSVKARVRMEAGRIAGREEFKPGEVSRSRIGMAAAPK